MYGLLGLPLAFAALPIYVHAPSLYAGSLGVPLATVGFVLLLVRVADAVTDPLLGGLSDRYAHRRVLILLSLPVLALGMVALLAPPVGAGAVWLGASLLVVSLGFSLATINYNAWGAEAATSPRDSMRLVAGREACALIGVVLAAVLPGVLSADELAGLWRSVWVFVPVLAMCAVLTLRYAPKPFAAPAQETAMLSGLLAAWHHKPFRQLLTVFAVSGVAAAIPASTVLFFVADVLAAKAWAGAFLALYFIAGACSMPLWVRVAASLGKVRAWLASMLLSVVVFAWAVSLASGDLLAYGVICVLSGIALGADLALPPAMLADLLKRDFPQGHARAGAWFGWWNFVTKANLAIAAGIALPLLGLFGYAPGVTDGGALIALAVVYAGLPCIAKLVAAALVWRMQHQLDFEGRLK